MGEEPVVTHTRPSAVAPRIWYILGDKGGDNAQVESLVGALDWPCERRYVHVRPPFDVDKPPVRPTLHHLDLTVSDPLEPPWPDLVITNGRRLSMVALWLRAQSGGHTKIVLLGKPSGMMDSFDLIISSAIAQLPPQPNVLHTSLPLTEINAGAIARAAADWHDRFGSLPRPLVAILLGGPTDPFVFDASVGERIVALAREVVDQHGGTPYVTTSRRTPDSVLDVLRSGLPKQARLFEWAPGSSDNPYLALLGTADGFVVTGDSVSMMVEVVRLRKSLAIFDPPLGKLGSLDQLRRTLVRKLFKPGGETTLDRLRRGLASAVYRTGIVTQTRDFRAFHRMLIERGLAVPVGRGFPPPTGEVPEDLPIAVRGVRELMAVQEITPTAPGRDRG